MQYRPATNEDIEFFREHGWLVVEDVIDAQDIDALDALCDQIIEKRHEVAFDWAWEKGTPRDDRPFKIVQASIRREWPEFVEAPYASWAASFGSALMGKPVEFNYEQFLAKPPANSAPTYWHQDEGYWGKATDEWGLTCWMPLHDTDAVDGCMNFIDAGHTHGVLEHRQPENVQSDLLYCDVDESRAVTCPLRRGSVTFHHSKTPHMTGANRSDHWRRAVTQHLFVAGVERLGAYEWNVYVNQFTGERSRPATTR